jgi:hypothetical protein
VAIAETANAPAATGGTTTAVTSASFTPTASSLLVAVCVIGNSTGSGTVTGTLSDSLTGAWTLVKRQNAAGLASSEVYVQDVGASPAARTVTLTGTGGTNAKGTSLVVKNLTGAAAAASQTGVTVGSTAGTTAALSITPGATGSYLVHALGYNPSSLTLTANANSTSLRATADATNGETYGICKGTNASTASTAVSLGWTNTGLTSGSAVQVAAEILASTGSTPADPMLLRSHWWPFPNLQAF